LDFDAFYFFWQKRFGYYKKIIFICCIKNLIFKKKTKIFKQETSNSCGFIVIVLRFFTIAGKHVNSIRIK
jgi:hypothetical protein